jgi:glutamate-1-semialdehyde 2,1-aminomutase
MRRSTSITEALKKTDDFLALRNETTAKEDVKVIDKWQTSRALLARAKASLAGGVSSPFRAKAPVPLYFRDSCGPLLKDADGNEYIDYTLGWGPNILGYRHPEVVEAVRNAACGAHTYGAQHELEFLVAEQIQRLVPCAERIAFTSSGSEAVQLMMRLARAYTGRNLILRFEGHYHGWMDTALWNHHPAREELGPREAPPLVAESRGQIPIGEGNILVKPWNDLGLVERAFDENPGKIGGVIMEPVLCNSGCILPVPGYLEGVKAICQRHDALLLFDEVITGFRIDLGGAQTYYGVHPDIATFGKAVGGGTPLSVVAGRRDIVEQMFTNRVAYGGTFNGNPLSLAGAHATLRVLSQNDGEALRSANRIGAELLDGIRGLADKHGVPLLVSGFGAAFAIHFTSRSELREYRDTLDDDIALLSQFLLAALTEGVHCLPDGRFYVSAVHGEREVEASLKALDAAFQHLESSIREGTLSYLAK